MATRCKPLPTPAFPLPSDSHPQSWSDVTREPCHDQTHWTESRKLEQGGQVDRDFQGMFLHFPSHNHSQEARVAKQFVIITFLITDCLDLSKRRRKLCGQHSWAAGLVQKVRDSPCPAQNRGLKQRWLSRSEAGRWRRRCSEQRRKALSAPELHGPQTTADLWTNTSGLAKLLESTAASWALTYERILLSPLQGGRRSGLTPTFGKAPGPSQVSFPQGRRKNFITLLSFDSRLIK